MSLLSELTAAAGSAFARLGLDPAFGEVVVASRPEFGDFQCNGALAAARQAGRTPREVAQQVADLLREDPRLARVEVAGPGFVNLTVDDDHLAAVVALAASDPRLGVAPAAPPQRVVIDYGGPNVAKAMHVGHLRATIIGDSLKRIFRFAGHQTIGDAHFGDWGLQMGQVIVELRRRSPHLPYFDPDHTGPYPEESPVTLEDLQEMYPVAAARCSEDPAILAEAQQATVELQQGRPGYVALWRHFVAVSQASQREDFARLGVHFDLWMGESDVDDRIPEMIERIRASGHAVESEGALVVQVARPDDSRELPPLILVTSRGSYLYSTTDLATIDYRVRELEADLILYVVDARQSDHFEQVFRAARLTGIAPEGVGLEHIRFGTMNGPDGKPFKTREGGVVRLRDLLDMVTTAAEKRLEEASMAREYPEEERSRIATQVGLAALKFADLQTHRTSNFTFDLDRFTSFEGKTGPYLQYAAVRIRSILRNADAAGVRPGGVLAPVVAQERELMLELTRLPEVVERAVELRAPNQVAEYAYGLSSVFNRFYDACHILSETDAGRQRSWLTLAGATLEALVLLLDLLGIEVPERM